MLAQFWTWWEDRWQGVALAPGESLSLECGGPNEEGYSYESVTFTYDEDAGGILSEHATRAMDCDGRLDQYRDHFCQLAKLQSIESEDGLLMPAWESNGASQRDYAAEAAGY